MSAMIAKKDKSVAIRTSRRNVVFTRPFILDGMDAAQPAGTYKVETEEESLDTMLSPAWKRVQTIMAIARSGATEYIEVGPEQLHEALIRDSTKQDSALHENKDFLSS
jgi:endo-1,4-beta-mannosidase